MGNKWKVIAIIFICLFVGLLALNILSYVIVVNEEDAIYDCYYNTCEEYYDADYSYGLCTCYSLNEYGEYEVESTSYKE